MGTAFASTRTLYAAAAIATLLSASLAPGTAAAQNTAPATCDSIFTGDGVPTVTAAYNERYKSDPKSAEAQVIRLGSTVTVTGANLEKLFAGPCAGKTVVLFVDGAPITGLTPNPPSDPRDKTIHFRLRRADAARDAWTPILGSPLTRSGMVEISMGFADGFPLKATAGALPVLKFEVVPHWWFLWALGFLLILGLFIYFARHSNIIRDPAPAQVNTLGTYSLSRLQGAWWFFVIIACYIFIGIVTGDFSNSVNSTAIILLGIGAGTVVGSAAIDAQKDTEESRAATAAAITKVEAEVAAGRQQAAALALRINALAPTDGGAKTQLTAERAATLANVARLDSQLRKLKGQSEGILTDILSDANGISFHRFQIAVWTLVLSVVFLIAVYQNLAMPEFNTTLMGLLGLSAGTYLGLKIPEPTTPSKPPLGT